MCEACVPNAKAGSAADRILGAIFGPDPDPAQERNDIVNEFIRQIERRLAELDGAKVEEEGRIMIAAGYLGAALGLDTTAYAGVSAALELVALRAAEKELRAELVTLRQENKRYQEYIAKLSAPLGITLPRRTPGSGYPGRSAG